MFRNYFKTAVRSLIHNKFFSVINVTGLTLGITTCLLILIYIENELSYEKFQKNRNNIYRVTVSWGQKGNIMKFAGCMPALAPAVSIEIPEVTSAIRIKKSYEAVFKDKENREIREDNVIYSDPGIFDMFSFKLREGNAETILNEPYTVVISRKISAKYFSTEDALGRELTYNGSPLKISGIMDDIPENTHLKCDFIISYSTLKAMGETVDQPWNSWGDDLTYLLLKDKSDLSKINTQLNGLLKKNAGDWFATQMKIEVQSLSDIHWDTVSRGDIGAKGNKTYIFIFLSAAVFVLLIACSNFLNLSISQYLGRLKEVGLRRTFGADRKQLLIQFMAESMLIVIISAIIGAFLFDGLYKKLYSYLGTSFVMSDNYVPSLAFTVLGIVIIVGVIAGGYPALFISRFNPVDIIRKDMPVFQRKVTLRKLLVMFQFSISVILITGTIIIFRQLNFMRNSNLGFSKENVILVSSPSFKEPSGNKYNLLRDELLKNSNVRYVTGAYSLPGINSQMNMGVRPEGTAKDYSVNIQALPADYGFAGSMGLEIIEGRDFSKDFATDKNESVLLNQSAVKALGLSEPVGKKLFIPGDEFKNGVKVIGVVKDFHIQSFQKVITPMMIFIDPKMYMFMAIRINPENAGETIKYIRSTFTSVIQGETPDLKYLNDVYNKVYSTEEKTGQLLTYFTILALLITCLGLFGFTSFTVNKRYKEVGIRKVLGIRIGRLALLLSGQIIFWILISGIIACPVAYLLINKWLLNFAYRINISWWIFAVAVGCEIIITLLTIGWLTIKAATRNPVEALRYE